MANGLIGLSFQELTPLEILAAIERADALGVPTWWMATGGAAPDALTLFAAAAARTKNIRMGTSIIPTFPRHPLVAVQQAEVIANLAPGRLVLGVGPSHAPIVSGTFGLPFERPLGHLREYVTILKSGLQDGHADLHGERFHVHADVPFPAPVPVMVSALQTNSFRLAGEVADGAISWICPAPYLRDVAMPALKDGATQANRPTPPLVGQVFFALSDDKAAVALSARKRLGLYPRLPSYQKMFLAAGFSDAQRGEWSESMLGAILVQGDEAAVSAGLRSFIVKSGASELIASLLPVTAEPEAELERAMRLIAGL